MTDLRSITYVCRIQQPLDAVALGAMCADAQVRHAALGVSGVLFYGEGGLIQTVEGEAANVEAVWQRSRADARQSDLVLLHDEHDVAHRAFSDWTMGWVLSERPHRLLPLRALLARADFAQVDAEQLAALGCLDDFIDHELGGEAQNVAALCQMRHLKRKQQGADAP